MSMRPANIPKTADIPKIAIINPFGLFKFLCLPFGLSNAAQTFQRMMDKYLVISHFVSSI